MLPIAYYKELPKKIQTAYKKKISELVKNPQNINVQIKKTQIKQIKYKEVPFIGASFLYVHY